MEGPYGEGQEKVPVVTDTRFRIVDIDLLFVRLSSNCKYTPDSVLLEHLYIRSSKQGVTGSLVPTKSMVPLFFSGSVNLHLDFNPPKAILNLKTSSTFPRIAGFQRSFQSSQDNGRLSPLRPSDFCAAWSTTPHPNPPSNANHSTPT